MAACRTYPPAPTEPPSSVGSFVTEGDDWTLPGWVTPSPYGGFYGTHPDGSVSTAEVQLAWKDIEPRDGEFDWSVLEAALADGTHRVWLRFYASDLRHLPAWLRSKYPDLPILRYRWPDLPSDDILGWKGEKSPGDFVLMSDPRVEREWRRVLQDFGRRGFSRHRRFAFAYYPHGWRWGEFSLKWVPEMAASGMTPEDYLAWFERTTQDYISAMNGDAGKLVYTGGGNAEWIEPGARLPLSMFDHWNTVINPPGGGNVLSQLALRSGTGVRDGYTELYNGFADRPDWGTRLTRIGRYRYSVTDDADPLLTRPGRFFGTENEDLQFLWPGVNTYEHSRLMILNTLRLRMNWMVPGDPKVAREIYQYAKLSLGQTAATSPDAWVALRQYRHAENFKFVNGVADEEQDIRNFERWLVQREVEPDGRTVPTEWVDYPKEFAAENGPGAFEALRTELARGGNSICFGVDDRFLFSTRTPIQLKVTYRDAPGLKWWVVYDGAESADQLTDTVVATGSGRWKTATIPIPDAHFANRQRGGLDFRLTASGQDLVVRFVRVIKQTRHGESAAAELRR